MLVDVGSSSDSGACEEVWVFDIDELADDGSSSVNLAVDPGTRDHLCLSDWSCFNLPSGSGSSLVVGLSSTLNRVSEAKKKKLIKNTTIVLNPTVF